MFHFTQSQGQIRPRLRAALSLAAEDWHGKKSVQSQLSAARRLPSKVGGGFCSCGGGKERAHRLTHLPFFCFLQKSRNMECDSEACVSRPAMKGSRRPAALRVFAHFPLLLRLSCGCGLAGRCDRVRAAGEKPGLLRVSGP